MSIKNILGILTITLITQLGFSGSAFAQEPSYHVAYKLKNNLGVLIRAHVTVPGSSAEWGYFHAQPGQERTESFQVNPQFLKDGGTHVARWEITTEVNNVPVPICVATFTLPVKEGAIGDFHVEQSGVMFGVHTATCRVTFISYGVTRIGGKDYRGYTGEITVEDKGSKQNIQK